MTILRRWFLDPSDAVLDAQGDVLCWALVIAAIWNLRFLFWLLWLPLMLAFGG